MNSLSLFATEPFIHALKAFFEELKVPVNYVSDFPTTAQEILNDTYKNNDTFQRIDDVYFLGMVDDAAFKGNESLDADKIKTDYDGILIFGVTIKEREKSLLPSRSQLAEIARAFNREFYYTPVVVVFKYGNFLAFANTERLKYKQEWREGEKAGKVSLLRDVYIPKPHSGHQRILSELQIPITGTKKVDSFAKLYAYWQEVFSVSLLNKKFYQELSNWYFWATQHVTFPGEPTIADGHLKKAKLEDLVQEHRATNVIRMLTRLLFVWFIKEKRLIPEELFELDALQKDILKEISPIHEKGMFKERNKESIYYKAILQNLFFATLNCPIEADNLDKRKRGFRGDGYGTHRGIDYLMRYKQYFKNPDAFLEKLNQTVPFLNGGLFECLDDKFNNIYIDGFSDQMTKGEQLVVPDYLFFGVEEETDLSDIVGIKDKKYKQAAVKGLINILKSYKFTITENTPIEEDVALDPELLGKVFENLLASYNPETKTTARKQTGSFYTPREIVNYMVDESLIAYLKNAITDWGDLEGEMLDKELHVLTSFDSKVPFSDNRELQREIITALSTCTILDPACGSGAFPMGILQKMVHILQKLDPDNKVWKEVQLEKARKESEAAFEIEDKQAREERLLEINEAFDQSINDPDYARKLFLIENCIYGVDIQPIATQISKLRFFISLVVEQKVNAKKDNFGIRPLPNLETKFVAANTLIGIDKPQKNDQLNLYNTESLKGLEIKLKKVRSKLFSAKSKETKLKYREEDKILRNHIAEELEKSGWKSNTAQKLAGWDPYDQNASSSFFDPEWMFDIQKGFNVIIGNPPYIKESTDKSVFDGLRNSDYYQGKMDLWYFFACLSLDYLCTHPKGILTFIATNNWITNAGASILRNKILIESELKMFIDFSDFKIFESAGIQTMVFVLEKSKNKSKHKVSYSKILDSSIKFNDLNLFLSKQTDERFAYHYIDIDTKAHLDGNINFSNEDLHKLLVKLVGKRNFELLPSEINSGIDIPQDFLSKSNKEKLGLSFNVGDGVFVLSNEEVFNLDLNDEEKKLLKPFFTTNELYRYNANPKNKYWIIYTDSSYSNPNSMSKYPKLKSHLDKFQSIITSENKPYGLNRSREEKFFKGERIIVQRKCPKQPSFVYVDFDTYFNRTFLPILTNRINLKYLVSILNSKVSAFWLRHKGKMQGDNFQVDKDPVLSIPIALNKKYEHLFISLVDYAIYSSEKLIIETIIDSLVFNLYFPDHMKERGIDVLEFVQRDIDEVMQKHPSAFGISPQGEKFWEFDKLIDEEKEQLIEALHAKWSNPDNELVKRMAMFKEKSPDILKPILES